MVSLENEYIYKTYIVYILYIEYIHILPTHIFIYIYSSELTYKNPIFVYASNEQNVFICNDKEKKYEYMSSWLSYVSKKARTVTFPHLDIFKTKSSFIL